MTLKSLMVLLPLAFGGMAGPIQAADESVHHHGHEQHGQSHGGHGAHMPAADAASARGEPPAQVSVQGCWIRALPSHLPSAGYFKVLNESGQDIALTGVRSDAFGHAMLHVNREEGGMSKMVHAGPIRVPAGGEFAFTTGNGYHVMLEQSKHALEVGATETLLFQFDRGGPLPVACAVKPPSALE